MLLREMPLAGMDFSRWDTRGRPLVPASNLVGVQSHWMQPAGAEFSDSNLTRAKVRCRTRGNPVLPVCSSGRHRFQRNQPGDGDFVVVESTGANFPELI